MNAGGRIGGLPGGGPGGGRTPGGAMPGRKGGAYSDGKALQQNSRDPIFLFCQVDRNLPANEGGPPGGGPGGIAPGGAWIYT